MTALLEVKDAVRAFVISGASLRFRRRRTGTRIRAGTRFHAGRNAVCVAGR